MNDDSKEKAKQANQASSQTNPSPFRLLRIWPPLLLIAGMVAMRFLPNLVQDGGPLTMLMAPVVGPMLCGILIILWWLFASRATWRERITGFVGVLVAVFVTLMLVDPSMRGPAIIGLTIPMGTAAFAIGAVLGSRWLSFKRTAIAILLATVGFGFSTLLRSEGLWGDFWPKVSWRWKLSAEERMLADRETPPQSPGVSDRVDLHQGLANPEWPGFRGADRTGIQRGPRIASDWAADPPKLLWKIAVGPAWSSFAVAGDLLFTQEQRGPLETVVCYHADSGKEVWAQSVEARFDDPLGGPGPRATPTLHGGALFVMGAQGLLLRLDPMTGDIAWQQDLRKIADREPPMWGFSSSPLVVGSLVVVFAGGAGDKGTLAFDIESGEPRWLAAGGDHSYSSPQMCTVGGEALVAMVTNAGLDLLDPETGKARLNYELKNDATALQPQTVNANTMLITTGMMGRTRCIRISKDAGGLSAEELWTSRYLKPHFNDYVLFEGHAYGFDGAIFTCVDLETGGRQWKKGRYRKGQVLLLKDSGLLLVAGERGEVVLLKADPAGHTELARIQALEGRTWNHPVVVGDRLYIRNAQEAACYRLSLAPLAVSATQALTNIGVKQDAARGSRPG